MSDYTALCSLVGSGAELCRSFNDLVSFGPRFTGSAGESKARSYLASRFASMGLKVELQEMPVRTYVRGEASARALGAEGAVDLECKAFAYAPSTAGVLALNLVHGGAGDSADVERLGDAIRGKAVYCRPSDEMRSKRHKNITERGAAAGVFGSHVAHHDACIISYVRDTAVPSIPAIGLNRSSTAKIERLIGAGHTRIEIEIRGRTEQSSSANLIATLEGTSDLPEIVVGGHLDTYDLSEGALDNSAGAAVILEAARVLAALSKPLRTVRFVLFTAEEVSCLGSKKFVSERVKDPARLGLFLNVDMPAEGGTPGILKSGGSGDDLFWASLSREMRHAFPFSPLTSRDSDHGPFVEKGVPAAWVRAFRHDGKRLSEIEHTVLDTGDKVDHSELTQSAILTALILQRLANSPVLPFGPAGSDRRAA